MARKWYSWKSRNALYDVPAAMADQLQWARSRLADKGVISFEDWDGHVGAVGLLRERFDVLEGPPSKSDIMRIVRGLCGHPVFDVERGVYCSTERTYRCAWIDPATITYTGELGERFEPYHVGIPGLAAEDPYTRSTSTEIIGALPSRRSPCLPSWLRSAHGFPPTGAEFIRRRSGGWCGRFLRGSMTEV